MPNYLLLSAYVLFVICVIACVFYVARSFEDDAPN